MSENTAPKLSAAEVESLFAEKQRIENWLEPTLDPGVWPPAGWQYHPQAPGYLVRMITEDQLREELFGSPAKDAMIERAKGRIAEIKAALLAYFFPTYKEEGMQRKTKGGFAVSVDAKITRKLDLPNLPAVFQAAQEYANKKKLGINVEEKVLKWTPKLKLEEFRTLPPKLREIVEGAFIETPSAEFEISRNAPDAE